MTAIVAADGTIEPVSDPVGTGHSVHFKDSTVALYQGEDQEPLPLKFTLDASTPTPEIDIEGHDGIFTLGLVETQNGTLRLQLGDAGGNGQVTRSNLRCITSTDESLRLLKHLANRKPKVP